MRHCWKKNNHLLKNRFFATLFSIVIFFFYFCVVFLANKIFKKLTKQYVRFFSFKKKLFSIFFLFSKQESCLLKKYCKKMGTAQSTFLHSVFDPSTFVNNLQWDPSFNKEILQEIINNKNEIYFIFLIIYQILRRRIKILFKCLKKDF